MTLWRSLVKAAITLLLLALLVRHLSLSRLAAAFSTFTAGDLVLALLLALAFLSLKALRWGVVLHAGGARQGWKDVVYSYLAGMTLGVATPARVGELARGAYLPDHRRARVTALAAVDKVLDLGVVALLSAPGATHFLGPAPGVGIGFLGVAMLLLLLWNGPWRRGAGLLARMPVLGQRLGGGNLRLARGQLGLAIVLTVLAFAAVLLQYACLLEADLRAVALAIPPVIFTNAVPVTVGGLGVREGAAAVLLGRLAVEPARAAAAAFTLFLMNTLFPGIVGVGAINRTLMGRPGNL